MSRISIVSAWVNGIKPETPIGFGKFGSEPGVLKTVRNPAKTVVIRNHLVQLAGRGGNACPVGKKITRPSRAGKAMQIIRRKG